MNAAEARTLAEGLNSDAAKEQYQTIKAKIVERAQEGQFTAYFYESIMFSVKLQLQNEGYKIESDFIRNETTVTISW